MENQQLLTIKEAAHYCNVSKQTIYRWNPPCIRINKRVIRFEKPALDAFLRGVKESITEETKK